MYAPGEDILTEGVRPNFHLVSGALPYEVRLLTACFRKANIALESGTSLSAPIVAGLIASAGRD